MKLSTANIKLVWHLIIILFFPYAVLDDHQVE